MAGDVEGGGAHCGVRVRGRLLFHHFITNSLGGELVRWHWHVDCFERKKDWDWATVKLNGDRCCACLSAWVRAHARASMGLFMRVCASPQKRSGAVEAAKELRDPRRGGVREAAQQVPNADDLKTGGLTLIQIAHPALH